LPNPCRVTMLQAVPVAPPHSRAIVCPHSKHPPPQDRTLSSWVRRQAKRAAAPSSGDPPASSVASSSTSAAPPCVDEIATDEQPMPKRRKTKPGADDPESSLKSPPKKARTGEVKPQLQASPVLLLTPEHWAELHEFDRWLESPEATRFRGDVISKDIAAVKALLAQPATQATLKDAARFFQVQQKRQKTPVWHARCVDAALHRFRTWRRVWCGIRRTPNSG
jgi:hypothetical protein